MHREHESTFVSHLPCGACGSSDANALYSDGHTYCWKCKAYKPAGDAQPLPAQHQKSTVSSNLIGLDQIEIRAITARHLDEATCHKFGYGIATLNGQSVQVAPYHDRDGRVVAQKIRFANKNFIVLGSLKEAGLFGQQLWRDGGKKVVITEGEIDCLSVSRLQDNRWPVVSIPNGAQGAKAAIQRQLDWLEGFEEVVFMFDMDEPGRQAAMECALLISPGKAKIATLPLKDANEMLKAGRGKELIDAIWGAKVYRPDGIVTGQDVWEYVVKEDTTRSATFPHTGLQAKTLGLRGGEVVTITAGTGSGKSTLCRELAFHLMQTERVGYIALEEPIKRSILGLCSIRLNTPLHLNMAAVSQETLRTVFDQLCQQVVFYDHFGSLDSDNLLNKIRYMVKGCGCNYIVLDHLSIVVSGLEETDERRAIDLTMTRLASLAQETGACIILVSHLKKSDGKPHEEGKPVSLSDLRGSHGIAQLSHTIISIERDQQNEEERHLSRVRVLKCRHTGDTGLAGHMKFDRETGRLEEYEVAFGAEGSGDSSEKDF